MLCDECKKREAVINIQEHSPSGVRTVKLCLECATVKGLNIRPQDVQPFINNFLSNLFNKDLDKALNMPSLKLLNLRCPNCGTPLNKILEENIVGCNYCFVEFSNVIESVIFSNNNSIKYKGSLPEAIDKDRKYKMTILKLKKQLRESIQKDDFSSAVVIRDKIKNLKKTYRQDQLTNE